MHLILILIHTIIITLNQKQNVKLSRENQTIKMVKKNSTLIEFDSLGNEINEKKIWTPKGFDLTDFELYNLNENSLFLNNSSGIVYQLFKDSIKRKDQSYDDKIHNYSLNFIYKDTLFRFGGYGYFHLNKDLIYFDTSSGQWDLVKYKNHNKINPFAKVGFHFMKEDELHIINYINFDSKYTDIDNIKDDGFILDLKNRTVLNKKEVNSNFTPPDSYFQIDENYVFLFYKLQRKILILKIKDLTLHQYILDTEESSIINEGNNNFAKVGENLYYLRNDINKNIFIKSIKINSVLDNMSKAGYLYTTNSYLFYLIITLIIFTVFITLYRFIKNDKVIEIKDLNLVYGKINIPMDGKMIDIIGLLMKSDFVSNVKINELFYKEGINKTHLNREKNNCINKINILFNLHTKKKLIFKRKSDFDKRMTEYYINKDI